MNYLNLRNIIALIMILYLLEVALVASSKPIGEDYLPPVLKYEKLNDAKVYPLYQDDAKLFGLVRTNSWLLWTMSNLAKLFWTGPGRENDSIESWNFTTPDGNTAYFPKVLMSLNSHVPSNNYCAAALNPRTGSYVLEGWGRLSGYYPFLHKEYYSERWAKKYSITKEEAWKNYTDIIESQEAGDLYISNVLMGYRPSEELRGVYYYGDEGKLIVDTQMLSEAESKDLNLFVDGKKREFEREGSILITDVGMLESGEHSAEINVGNLSKKLEFEVEWVGIWRYKLNINGTLEWGFINLRNESIVLKKFTVNDTSIAVDRQLPALGEGLVYYNESKSWTLPFYNVSIQVPLGEENSLGDCKSFNIAVEYSLPDGRIVKEEWENFGMRVEMP
jgi:hypothetical protein